MSSEQKTFAPGVQSLETSSGKPVTELGNLSRGACVSQTACMALCLAHGCVRRGALCNTTTLYRRRPYMFKIDRVGENIVNFFNTMKEIRIPQYKR